MECRGGAKLFELEIDGEEMNAMIENYRWDIVNHLRIRQSWDANGYTQYYWKVQNQIGH